MEIFGYFLRDFLDPSRFHVKKSGGMENFFQRANVCLCDSASGVGNLRNNSGVAKFTETSVVCAESTVAIKQLETHFRALAEF